MAESAPARTIARGGMIVLLTVLGLYLVNVFPTVKIFLFSFSTAFLALMVIEDGKRAAVLTFLAAALLGLILVPNKVVMLPYILYFGYYGIIKSIFEQRASILQEWLLKYFTFNLALLLFYIAGKFIFSLPLESKFPLLFLWLLGQFYFFIYDYAYSLFISYYHRYRRLIKK